MKSLQKVPTKKYFTVAEANATLPLLRVILRDVTELGRDLHDRHQRLIQLQKSGKLTQEMMDDFERAQEKMQEFEEEIRQLHVELKDHMTGLVDFPCWMDNREVYLCWRLGEPEVSYWHDLDAGFAGRQKLAFQVTR